MGILGLLSNAISSKIETIVILLMFMVYIGNANLVNLFFPLSALLYAVLADNLTARFWTVVNVYQITEIFIKILI